MNTQVYKWLNTITVFLPYLLMAITPLVTTTAQAQLTQTTYIKASNSGELARFGEAQANLGDAGHRWLTAVGPIEGDHALLNIEMTSGGIFDTSTEITRTDPPGSDGTLLLTFNDCSSGIIEYDIPSINQQGIVPIQRVAGDNIVVCDALSTN